MSQLPARKPLLPNPAGSSGLRSRPAPLSRRGLLQTSAALALGAPLLTIGTKGQAATGTTPSTLTVMTSYPNTLTSRMVDAFQKAHPDISVSLLWRMPHDAMPVVTGPEGREIDVYWSPAPAVFRALVRQDALQPLSIDHSVLPNRIGDNWLADPKDRTAVIEIAGYGMVIAPKVLAARNLPRPADLDDLTSTAWEGQVILPVPSHVGYAHAWLGMILQHRGWDKGWTLVSALAANARFLLHGSTFATDELSEGRAGAAITMDFFANAAIAGGAPLEFLPTASTGYMPAHIGILRSAQHPEAAKLFVDFVLSDAAQKMLFHPDLRKLPIRPSAWTQAPAGLRNPLTSSEIKVPFNIDRFLDRRASSAALFDLWLVEHHDALGKAWATLHALELARDKTAPALRTLLSTPPVSEQKAAASQDLFTREQEHRTTTEDEAALASTRADWKAAIETSLQGVSRLLEAV